MSAEGSSGGAGGGDGRKEKAPPCARCGNRHTGLCLPQCGVCGKVHKGKCRYANPVPFNGSLIAGQQPAQSELNARFQAQQIGQQIGHQMGYQQAYNEIQAIGMGPAMGPPMMVPTMVPAMVPMGPAMGGQFLSRMGSFGSPYPVQYGAFGGFGAVGNQGWGGQGLGNQMPGQFGQFQGGLAPPPMGRVIAASPYDNDQSVSSGHSGRASIRGAKGGSKQQSKQQSKANKEQRGPLAPASAGIEKPISRSAKERERKKRAQARALEAKKAAERKEGEEHERAGMSGPELLALMAEPEVANAGYPQTALANERQMEGNPLPNENDGAGIVRAQKLIDEAIGNPTGFQLPQDRERIGQMAQMLERFGQDRLEGLSEAAAVNGTSIIREAFEQDLYNEVLSDLPE